MPIWLDAAVMLTGDDVSALVHPAQGGLPLPALRDGGPR
jgi:hypothetical protein